MEGFTNLDSVLRSSEHEILAENEIIALQKLFSGIFDSMTGISAILNRNRQIIYTNYEYLSTLGLDSIEPLLGKRPGESLSCMNADTGPDGCGTSPACQFCGIFRSITECRSTGMKTVSEASMTTYTDGEPRNWDLRVTCTPMEIEGHEFFVVSLQDIAAEKRLAALERIFFHDILNTASGLNGLLTVLKDEKDPQQTIELLGYTEEASRTIIDEISLFRQLRSAENGDLKVSIQTTDSLELLRSLAARNTFHIPGKQVEIQVDTNSTGISLETDQVLLQRVLTNLLKNAVEASQHGGKVIAGTTHLGDNVSFYVRNAGTIPPDVRQQIFQRSFSTKGAARGLGTYSVKLLTEKYLRGRAMFTSDEIAGTEFRIEIPARYTT